MEYALDNPRAALDHVPGTGSICVVLDASSSATTDQPCEQAVEQVRRLQRAEKFANLRLDVFTSGDQTTAFEPRPLIVGDVYRAKRAKLFASENRTDGFEAWLRGIEERCKASFTRTDTSPIYIAAARCVSSLTADVTGETGARRNFLFVHSDLVESVEPSLAAQIPAGRAGRLNGTLAARGLPAPLPTAGIKISVCGLSEHQGKVQVPLPPDALYQIWRPVLGDGAPPAFAPACPMASKESTP